MSVSSIFLDSDQSLCPWRVDFVGENRGFTLARLVASLNGERIKRFGELTMINPNICKYVLVKVLPKEANSVFQYAIYRGHKLEIMDRDVKPYGNRRMYLKFSIMSDSYYLRSR